VKCVLRKNFILCLLYTIDLIKMTSLELGISLKEGQKFVRDYFSATTEEAKKDIISRVLSKKDEAIRKATTNKTVINDTIKTIYVLAYIFIDKGLNSRNLHTKKFLELNEKDDDIITRKVKRIFTELQLPNSYDPAVLTPYDIQRYKEIRVTTVPPAVTPAVTSVSPTEGLTEPEKVAYTKSVMVEKDKRDRAKALLEYTFKKFEALIKSKKSDFSTIDERPYFTDYYYDNVMGFDKTNLTYNQDGKTVSVNTYKDYILDDKIYDMVKKFIDKITYEGTPNDPNTFTLHDVIGRWVSVDKSNPKTNSSDPSDYCKARAIFISILEFIKTQVPPLSWANFSYSSSGGLLKSSQACTPLTNRNVTDPLRSVNPNKPFCIIETVLTDVPVQPLSTDESGGSKSRRIRRRKHNRKTHRKHARKTHHKRASKSHKHRRHSRAARKHKKHTSRR